MVNAALTRRRRARTPRLFSDGPGPDQQVGGDRFFRREFRLERGEELQRLVVALIAGQGLPYGSAHDVPRHPGTIGVEAADKELGVVVARLGEVELVGHRRAVVACAIGHEAGIENGRLRYHGHGNARSLRHLRVHVLFPLLRA